VEIACGFLHEIVLNGGSVLFVGTKKQAQQEVKEAALRTTAYCVDRWLGGTLTNLRTIRNSVKRCRKSTASSSRPKANICQEGSCIASPRAKQTAPQPRRHRENGAGARRDVRDRHHARGLAIHEAKRSGSRSLPLWTPNCDPDHATYPIAGNDDAIRASS